MLFRSGHSVDARLGLPDAHHAVDHLGVLETSAEDLLHSDIVNIELPGALWQRVQAGFGDEATQ